MAFLLLISGSTLSILFNIIDNLMSTPKWLLSFMMLVLGFSLREDECHLPLNIDCPPLDYCGTSSTIIGDTGTNYNCN